MLAHRSHSKVRAQIKQSDTQNKEYCRNHKRNNLARRRLYYRRQAHNQNNDSDRHNRNQRFLKLGKQAFAEHFRVKRHVYALLSLFKFLTVYSLQIIGCLFFVCNSNFGCSYDALRRIL